MHQAWQTLLANVAVISVFISIWISLQGWLQNVVPEKRDIIFGTMCGATGLVVMTMPVEFVPGAYLDLRNVAIILAGFFSGPVGGLIAGSMTGAYRLWMGGSGVAPGLIGIGISVALAVFLHLRNRKSHITFSDIVDLAFVGAGSSIIVILVVSALRHGSAFEQVAAPGVTLIFGSLLLSGAAILQERRRQETATTNAIYGAIMDALPDCLNVKDSEGRFLVANPATAALMGAADKYALIGRKDGDFYDAETAEKFREEQKRVVRWGNPETIEQKFRSTNGTMTWLTTLMVPFPSKDGREIGIITHNRDITQQKQIELDLAETQARLSDALTHMADGLVMFDGNGQLVYASDRFRKMFSIPDSAMLTGASLRTVLGEAMDHFGFVLPEGMSKQDWIEEELLKVARMESTEFQLRDGRWFQNRHGSVRDGAWLTVFSDITERKLAEQALIEVNAKLEILARTDGLTGLTNRKTFDDKLYAEFSRSHRHGSKLGLMMIDVDRFKAYNDIYGHPQGDECLKAVADCLKNVAKRPPDTVARYGGEEFVAIFPETDEAGMQTVAEQFRQGVQDLKRIHVGSERGVVTVSIGVAMMGPNIDLRGPADLLRVADAALYQAKGAGRNCVRAAEIPASTANSDRGDGKKAS